MKHFNVMTSNTIPALLPSQEPAKGSVAAAVKAAMNTSEAKGKQVTVPPEGKKHSGKPKKASPKKTSKDKGSKGDSADERKDSKGGSADEDEDSKGGSADEHEDSKGGSADKQDDGLPDEEQGKTSKQSPKSTAPKNKATPKAKSSNSKKNDGKKGKNKIEGGATSSSGKRPVEEPQPRKQTALTEGWKKFSQDYFREHKHEGKKLGQLMKEAGELCRSQLLLRN